MPERKSRAEVAAQAAGGFYITWIRLAMLVVFVAVIPSFVVAYLVSDENTTSIAKAAHAADRLSVQARRLGCNRGDLTVLRDSEGWAQAHYRATQNARAGGADSRANRESATFYEKLSVGLLARVVVCRLAHPYPGQGLPRNVTDWKFIRRYKLPGSKIPVAPPLRLSDD